MALTVEVMASGLTVSVTVESVPQVVIVERTVCGHVLVVVGKELGFLADCRYFVMQVCLLVTEVDIFGPFGRAPATAASNAVISDVGSMTKMNCRDAKCVVFDQGLRCGSVRNEQREQEPGLKSATARWTCIHLASTTTRGAGTLFTYLGFTSQSEPALARPLHLR